MAEKSIEEKARKIASQQPQAGKEFEQLQGAQNQLLEIQAAQKQNLMERRVMANSQAEQNQILAQAAEVGAQSVAGNMQLNQATQQTMGRFGLNQPRTSSQTKQQHSESVTRQNVTIHNNTTNITNNTVPANIGGPLQGRPVQFQQPQDGNGGMGKFRNWLNQTFVRQEEAAKKRDREYQRRETSLTKSANKMMRKIEEFSKDITKKLDPRNVGKTVGGQLKTIFGILGIGLLAKNFDKVLDWLFGAQKKVEEEYIPNIKNFFGWVRGDENSHEPGFITKITQGIENTFGKLFFGKDYESNSSLKEKGLLKGIRDYLWNEKNGSERGIINQAWDKIKAEFERRTKMAKDAIVRDKTATLGRTILHPGEAMMEFLNNITNYLGILVGGDAAMAKVQGGAVSRTAAIYSTATKQEQKKVDKSWRFKVGGTDTIIHADQGDISLIGTGKISAVPKEYMDSNGHIDGSVGSTIAISNNIARIGRQAHKGTVNSAAFANNFSELHRVAHKQGYIIVSKDLFYGNPAIKSALGSGDIKPIDGNRYHYVLRPRPAEDIRKEAKEINKAEEFEQALMAMGIGLTLATGGASYFVAAGIAGTLAFYNDCKAKGIHTHTIAIVRDDEIMSGLDIDLGPLAKSGNDSWKELYVVTEKGLDDIAKSIFLSKEELNAGKALSYNTGDKDFVLSGQRFLESLNETTKVNYNGFNAESMTDVKVSQRYEAPAASTSRGAGRHRLMKQEELDAEETAGGSTFSNVRYLEGKDASDYEGEDADIREAPGRGEVFDVDAAVNYLVGHANATSTGYCAKHVRQAMQAGGLNVDDRPGYAEYLPKKGWKQIPLDTKPQPGDTVVVKPFIGKDGKYHKYGHIAMYAGEQGKKYGKTSGWVSDFIQGTREGYTNGPDKSLVSMWRYGTVGEVEKIPGYTYTGSGEAYTGNIEEWIDDVKDKAKGGANGSFSNFLSGARETIREAIGGLSHRIDQGANWALDKYGGAMDFEASTTGGVSGVRRGMSGTENYMATKYMNSRYSGFDNKTYAVPSRITGGSKLNRDEWWADFFDKDGNLKVKESDVNPQILNQLHEIQGELKKGNDLDELHLKIAADGLDAEMYHSATQDQNQRRLLSAFLVNNTGESRAESITRDNV